MIVNVKDYGAKADGKTLDTKAFQAAVDALYENGGGTVVVTPGKYYVGKIILKDNITIDLNSGAELIASSDCDNDYERTTKHYEGSIYTHLEKIGYFSDDSRKEAIATFYAADAKNIRITGMGTINGNYKEILLKNIKAEKPRWIDHLSHVKEMYSIDRTVECFRRPISIYMENCHNIVIDSMTIKDGSWYGLQFRGCENILVNNIKIYNYIGADNADGIHFASCYDAVVTNCVLKCGDDCIAVDSNDLGNSARITVSNCVLNSRNNCFRIYTNLAPHLPRREIYEGSVISDITINNCVVEDASSFINLHADHGTIERVTITNATGKIGLLGTVFLLISHSGKVKDVNLNNWCFESNGVGYIYSNVKDGVSDVRISDMTLNIKPKTKIYGNGFNMPTNSEQGYYDCGDKPIYFLSHYAPYFLQISNALNVDISDVSINWSDADIDDIGEIEPIYEEKFKQFWSYPTPWKCVPHWPAVYVENSKNIKSTNLECEAFGDDEKYKILTSENVNLN